MLFEERFRVRSALFSNLVVVGAEDAPDLLVVDGPRGTLVVRVPDGLIRGRGATSAAECGLRVARFRWIVESKRSKTPGTRRREAAHRRPSLRTLLCKLQR